MFKEHCSPPEYWLGITGQGNPRLGLLETSKMSWYVVQNISSKTSRQNYLNFAHPAWSYIYDLKNVMPWRRKKNIKREQQCATEMSTVVGHKKGLLIIFRAWSVRVGSWCAVQACASGVYVCCGGSVCLAEKRHLSCVWGGKISLLLSMMQWIEWLLATNHLC